MLLFLSQEVSGAALSALRKAKFEIVSGHAAVIFATGWRGSECCLAVQTPSVHVMLAGDGGAALALGLPLLTDAV